MSLFITGVRLTVKRPYAKRIPKERKKEFKVYPWIMVKGKCDARIELIVEEIGEMS